ncbi:MAG: SRPBCC domain-containing protein, partial [Chloroflexota bacterium]
MPDILLEATINTAPDKVYAALTDQEAIRSWWTQQATAVPKVGTVSEFGFYGGQVLMKMEVAKLEANKVVWKPLSG